MECIHVVVPLRIVMSAVWAENCANIQLPHAVVTIIQVFSAHFKNFLPGSQFCFYYNTGKYPGTINPSLYRPTRH